MLHNSCRPWPDLTLALWGQGSSNASPDEVQRIQMSAFLSRRCPASVHFHLIWAEKHSPWQHLQHADTVYVDDLNSVELRHALLQ